LPVGLNDVLEDALRDLPFSPVGDLWCIGTRRGLRHVAGRCGFTGEIDWSVLWWTNVQCCRSRSLAWSAC